MPKRELIDITAEIKGETDAAYRIYDGARTEWVPKSQVEVAAEMTKGTSNLVTVTMPEWLAREKGFI